MAALAPWMSDAGAVIGVLAATSVVIAAVATFTVFLVRWIMRPELDRIHRRIDEHMGEEERQIDRMAIALDLIAARLTIDLPEIRGGSDEG